MKKEIKIDIVFKHTSDEGNAVLVGKCPICKQEIAVSDFQWWDAFCKCGYKWELKAVGILTEQTEDDL